jgi:enamine deaminase RidA (YjgF/YER057c/UK114 family)
MRKREVAPARPGEATPTDSGRASGAVLSVGPAPNLPVHSRHSLIDLGETGRLALLIAPQGRGAFEEQTREVLRRTQDTLDCQRWTMVLTSLTVFLRDGTNQAPCEALLKEHFGPRMPAINYLLQAPCCGAALAIEAWAIGGASVQVEHLNPQSLAVSYDGMRWVHCAGFTPARGVQGVYEQTLDGLRQMEKGLRQAGSGIEHVVRTWLYLGGITELEGPVQRYHELNRARSDFYQSRRFQSLPPGPDAPRNVYPASTGIGMAGTGLVMSCLTLETKRDDLVLLPLENPRQTPAYTYHPKHSPSSPKFSRAMALVSGDYVTTWISGTASIVNSESLHLGDIARQTEQVLDNIEGLVARENFAWHGVAGAGARLSDLAKIRVYLKRPEDFARCKAVCRKRLGPVPAIYAVADICRPELLVEIEGVAFSRRAPAPTPA